ncbi:MAG: endonuclease [Ferruginibacter sp.]
MLKKFTSLSLLIFICFCSSAQVIISNLATTYSQDFNTLALSGTSSTLPTGWNLFESGTGANLTYAADNGGVISGNTYSYGTTSSAERAFGGLLSGSVTPTIGVQFTNTSGATINSITVTYTGEQWRLGALGRLDKLDFQYSQDASALNNGTWTDVNSLDLIAPVTSGTVGALDGNAIANKTSISFTITGLNIINGTSFWFRWNDFNPSGSDDGLAVDDFNANFSGQVLPACAEPGSQPSSLVLSSTPTTVTGNFTAATPAPNSYLIIRSTTNTLSAFPVDGTSYIMGQALGGGIVIAQTSSTSFQDINLQPATIYYYYIFSLNDEDCSGGPNYFNTTPLENNIPTQALPSCVAPATPTSLNLSSTNTSISGTFTGVIGNNKYLVVISSSATLSASPVNGNVYTAGQSFGGGTVVSFTNATSFSATGLTANSLYYIFVFAAGVECSGEPFFNSSSVSANISTTNSSGIPVGYYDGATGLSCQSLKTALRNIVSTGHVQLTYTPGVWLAYQYTDIKRNDANTANIIWDIYSDNPTGPEPYTFTYQVNQCGTYSGEGNCYNREHSTPKSWFADAYPMYTDVHHLYPTDGYVNNVRNNFPYGEVTNPTITSLNGSKLGTGNNFGYTATVFEPINEYKGDLARTSLYMATRYENEIIANNWSANGTANALFLSTTDEPDAAMRKLQVYDTWYLKTVFKWLNQDPVSQKEIDRNNAIYYQSGQSNRNPFVDHPEYAFLVWQCTGVVPVTIIDFKSIKSNESIVLKWYATYETNFRLYEIERSIDGINYNKIGEVAGQNLANYTFTDVNLPVAVVVYYRLKMIDTDGKFAYSKIVTERLNNVYNTIIYPNPTNNSVNIRLSKAIAEQSFILVSDVTGRVVKKQQVSLNQNNIFIDVEDLSAGRYFVQFSNGILLSQKSFVIIK